MAGKPTVELVISARDEITRILRTIGPNADEATRRLAAGLNRADQSLRQVEKSSVTAGREVQRNFGDAERIVRRLIGTVTALASAYVGLRAIRTGVQDSIEFGRALAEITTILPDTEAGIAGVREEIERLAVAQGQDRAVVAKGFYETLSSGFEDAADAAKVLEASTVLATAGLAQVPDTVRLLTATLNAYGIEVEKVNRVSDIYFETVKVGVTTIPELAGSIGRVTPLAAALKIPLEQVTGALATLTKRGFDTSQAATVLQALFKALLSQGDQINKVFERQGQTYTLATARTLGFAKTIGVLASGLRDEAEALEVLGGRAEAAQALISLTGGALSDLVETTQQITDAQGSAAKANAIIVSEAGFRAKAALNAFRTAFNGLTDELVLGAAEVVDALGGPEALFDRLRPIFHELGRQAADFVKGAGEMAASIDIFADSAELAAAKVELLVIQLRQVYAQAARIPKSLAGEGEAFGTLLGELIGSAGPDAVDRKIDELETKLEGLNDTIERIAKRGGPPNLGLIATREQFEQQLAELRNLEQTQEAINQKRIDGLRNAADAATEAGRSEIRALEDAERAAIQRIRSIQDQIRARRGAPAGAAPGDERFTWGDLISSGEQVFSRLVQSARDAGLQAGEFFAQGMAEAQAARQQSLDQAALFDKERLALLEQLPPTLERNIAAIQRWSSAERERLALLAVDNGLSTDQVAALQALREQVEAERIAREKSNATNEESIQIVARLKTQFISGLSGALIDIKNQTGSASERMKRFLNETLDLILRLILELKVLKPLLDSAFATSGAAPGGGASSTEGAVASLVQAAPLFLAAKGHPGLPGGIRFFQHGSPRVSQPTFGVVGEGRLPEAVIPLPDGVNVPVKMMLPSGDTIRGGGGGTTYVNVVWSPSIQALDGPSVRAVLESQDAVRAFESQIIRALRNSQSVRGQVSDVVRAN